MSIRGCITENEDSVFSKFFRPIRGFVGRGVGYSSAHHPSVTQRKEHKPHGLFPLTIHIVDGNELAETDDHERIAGRVVVQ